MAFLSPLTAASTLGRTPSTPEKANSISDVLSQSLTTRSALDALCLGLSHKFVAEIAEAEDVFAKSVSKAREATLLTQCVELEDPYSNLPGRTVAACSRFRTLRRARSS